MHDLREHLGGLVLGQVAPGAEGVDRVGEDLVGHLAPARGVAWRGSWRAARGRPRSGSTRDGTGRPRRAARGGAAPSARRRRRPTARGSRAAAGRRPASGSGRPSAGCAGRGRSCARRARSWWPCRGRAGAASPRPPNACAIAWWPRHTPSVGTPASGIRRTSSSVIPASSGVHGPGETTQRSKPLASSSSTVARSLRTVWHLRAQLAEVLDEVVGERVVVVEDEDPHAHSGCSQASAIARIAACALATDSSYSKSGCASATVPPPACTWATPSLTTTVRMWIAVSRSPP